MRHSGWVQVVGRRTRSAIIIAAMACLVVLGTLLPTTVIAQATAASPAARGVAGRGRIMLQGEIPRALTTAKRIDRLNGRQTLHLTVALQLPNPDGLRSLIAQQQDRTSPNYHRYLTPSAFVDRFAPSSQTVSAVVRFLNGAGLRVTSVSQNRLTIQAAGDVAHVEAALDTSIARFHYGKREIYAPERNPSVPAALGSSILYVYGLDDVRQLVPLHTPLAMPNSSGKVGTATVTRRAKMSPKGASQPRVLNPTPWCCFYPIDLQNAYDVGPLLGASGNGAGQRVAVFELAPYIPSDIAAYRTQFGLPNSPINPISLDGVSATGDAPNTLEADLDIEVVSALAPYATQDVYVANNDFDIYNAFLSADLDQTMTVSWGSCEYPIAGGGSAPLDLLYQQAAAQGQSIFVASGDNGSDDCGSNGTQQPTVDIPADNPYAVAVGGTVLNMDLNNDTFVSEDGWNGSGGGHSYAFSMPVWQAGAGVQNSYSNGNREVPDVAANAGASDAVYCTSAYDCSYQGQPIGWSGVGGTSAAAPLWAGVLADINSYLTAVGSPQAGWAAQALYELFANAQPYTPFRDITTGDNGIDYGGTAYQGDFPATTCYDMVTGIGSPDAWDIARDLHGGVQLNGGGPCAGVRGPAEMIVDAGFEPPTYRWRGYSASGSSLNLIRASGSHSGSYAGWLCGYRQCDDRLWQIITVPGKVQSATLSYWLSSVSAFGLLSSQDCFDHFYVTLATTDGTVFDTAQVSCASDSLGYAQQTADLTAALQAHTNQQIIVMFRGVTSNVTSGTNPPSVWTIDDLSLVVS